MVTAAATAFSCRYWRTRFIREQMDEIKNKSASSSRRATDV